MQCPGCDRSLKPAARSCPCGWAMPDAIKRGEDEKRHDPHRGRCSWNGPAGRCRFPGALSNGTRGDQPFYCWLHFRCEDPVTGDLMTEKSNRWDGDFEALVAMRRRGEVPA